MAIFKNSPFGNLKNSLADTIATRYLSRNVVRSAPLNYNDANTATQQNNRGNFRACVYFYKMHSSVLKLGLTRNYKRITIFNLFMSLNISGNVYPLPAGSDKIQIVPEDFKVANGIFEAPNLYFERSATRFAITNYGNSSADNGMSGTDKLYLYICSLAGFYTETVNTGMTRADSGITLSVPKQFLHDDMYFICFWRSATKNLSSIESRYQLNY